MSQPPLSAAIPFSIACLGIAFYASMDTLMKSLSIEMGVYNALLWRNGAGFLMATVLMLSTRQRWPQAPIIKLHVWRGAIISVIAFLFFWGLVHVPLAEAIALSFIAPLIALYLAKLLLHETISHQSVIASVIGFAGALVIIGGKLGSDYSADAGKGIIAILLSAVLYAYNLILQRQQALVANPIEIAFFQSGVVVGIYLLFAPVWAVTPTLPQLPQIGITALLGILGSLLISWAYARAEAKVLIPVEYSAFAWAALLGWLVFAETVTLATLAGTLLIVVGSLVAARQKPARVEHVETTAL